MAPLTIIYCAGLGNILRRCCFQKLLLVWTFSCINKNGYFIMETDTVGYIVVWTIYTSHTDHFTPPHTTFEHSAACLSGISDEKLLYLISNGRTHIQMIPSLLTFFTFFQFISSHIKVRKKAKIRNWYNQITHLIQDVTWESDKIQEYITYKRTKRPALFQQMTTMLQWTDKTACQTRNINNKKDPQKKHRLGTVSIFLLEALS